MKKGMQAVHHVHQDITVLQEPLFASSVHLAKVVLEIHLQTAQQENTVKKENHHAGIAFQATTAKLLLVCVQYVQRGKIAPTQQ